MTQLTDIFEFIDQFSRMSHDEQVEKDEFGRDNSMRKSKNTIEYEKSVQDLRLMFKGKSWIEVQWELEEKEEKEEEEKRAQLRKMDQEKKQQYLRGEYEIEEGEVFE